MNIKVVVPGDKELDIDPSHEWAALPAKVVAHRYADEMVKELLRTTPSWTPSGYLPVIVTETRGEQRVLHPFIFDIGTLYAN